MEQTTSILNRNLEAAFDKSSNKINSNFSNSIIFIKTNENSLKGIMIQSNPTEINSNKLMIKPPKTPSYRKSMWTEVEDQLLLAAVQKYGTHNWGIVAASVSGRTRKQCRERWAGKLNPELVKEPWTDEEDLKLKELHEKFGNKWALISVHLPGRSPIMLKNRWGFILRHSNQSKINEKALNKQYQTPLVANNNINEIIQQNDNEELLNTEEKNKIEKNSQDHLHHEIHAIAPPFYPPKASKDNSNVLPFSLDN